MIDSRAGSTRTKLDTLCGGYFVRYGVEFAEVGPLVGRLSRAGWTGIFGFAWGLPAAHGACRRPSREWGTDLAACTKRSPGIGPTRSVASSDGSPGGCLRSGKHLKPSRVDVEADGKFRSVQEEG
jgi:hypothetical protein